MNARPSARSIQRRLSWTLILCSLLGLALLCIGLYAAVAWKLTQQQRAELERRVIKLTDIAQKAERDGASLAERLEQYAPRRPGTRLTVLAPDGRTLYADPNLPAHVLGEHVRSLEFTPARVSQSGLRFRIEIDTAGHADLQRTLALMLLGGVVLAAGAIGSAAWWAVRRELRPLGTLTRQVQSIAPGWLSARVSLPQAVMELQPWVDQFNALLARLDQAYGQLESFNADVAHELRTPMNNIIGQTEVALSRQRSATDLRETLESNLEELQRLAGMVHDMLLLSRADRGLQARRGEPVSLAAVLGEVLDFHEAVLEERSLHVIVEGDARLAIDEPLFRRAVSNLLSNATRHADAGSTIRVSVAAAEEAVAVDVENIGPVIAAEHLPKVFDRFFRADAARADGDANHGLGLAIVAAIARMHGGNTAAASAGGVTRVGFSMLRPQG